QDRLHSPLRRAPRGGRAHGRHRGGAMTEPVRLSADPKTAPALDTAIRDAAARGPDQAQMAQMAAAMGLGAPAVAPALSSGPGWGLMAGVSGGVIVALATLAFLVWPRTTESAPAREIAPIAPPSTPAPIVSAAP